jgi:signal transduction histidine kinase
MKPKRPTISRSYQAALRRYTARGENVDLQAALKLGRRAVSLGLDTLDLALIHEQAQISLVLSGATAADRKRIISRGKRFFAKAILPMEETHRSALEAVLDLGRLNRSLSERTTDLSTSNRKLKKEIARRRDVEESLRVSQQHSTQLLTQSRRQQEQLRLLSRRILSVQEEERKRISRELHDVIAQMLTGINVQLATLSLASKVNSQSLSRKIASTQRLVERSVDVVHRFARELRPTMLDDLGLIPALHSLVKSLSKESRILIKLTVFAEVEELPSAKRTVLYRVAHEALANVARHAKGSRVEIKIRRLPAAVLMEIRDNGKGFDVDRVLSARKFKRLGLLGVRERVEMVGGTFAVSSTKKEGTTIRVQIPHKYDAKEPVHP